jgi:putative ABC transport system permease protein
MPNHSAAAVTGNPSEGADGAHALVNALPGAKVTDIASTQRINSSSLTAVDIHGLSQLVLGLAVLLVAVGNGTDDGTRHS